MGFFSNWFMSKNIAMSHRTTLGRNDPCWCGSGEKYKRCHLESDERKYRSLTLSKAHAGNGKRDAISRLKDWQDHQYTSGYYTGGNTPHYWSSKNPKLARGFMLQAILLFFPFVFYMVMVFVGDSDFGFFPLFLVGFLIFNLYVAYCILKKNNKLHKFKIFSKKSRGRGRKN